MATRPPPGPVHVDDAGALHLLAGWWRRAGGLLLDGLIIGVPGAIAGFAVGYHAVRSGAVTGPGFSGFSTTTTSSGIVAVSVLTALAGVAYAGILIGARGQTVGMMAVGVRAVDLHSGGPLGYASSWRRAGVAFALVGLAGVIESFVRLTGSSTGQTTAIVLLGVASLAGKLTTYLWPLGSARNQTLQDKAVSSVVVLARP